MSGAPENVVVVVKQRRGCTCCGTGCAVIALLVPLAVAALWQTFGAAAALAFWPAALAAAHAVRLGLSTRRR